MNPTLFDAAAERAAIESGRPLSQELAELVAPAPDPLPADSLFANPNPPLLARLVGCQVLQYPSGRWGFAGRVPVELAFVALDGGAPDPAEIEKRCQFGGSFGAVKARTFATVEEALAVLAEYEVAR